MAESSQIYGIRAVIEAIRSDESIDKIFIQKGLQGSLVRELEELLKSNQINHSYVPVEKLNRLNSRNHQGVIAQISPVRFTDLEDMVAAVLAKNKKAAFLLLDQVTDVRNFGAIIRTAECAGVDGLIVQNRGSAPVNADTVKTSAGAVFHLPIAKVTHIKDAIYYLQGSGIQVVAATEKTRQSLYEVDLSIPTAIIMGSEESGISPSVLKLADQKAKIPLMGATDSLNVSVACGVVLYELLRQRKVDQA